MKFVYASRTGNVESIIQRLGIEALSIESGSETVDECYILFTYTDGFGDVPSEVEMFLDQQHPFLKGVIVSGDKNYGEAFCQAGELIAQQYDVPCLYKVENEGTENDLIQIREILDQYTK